MQTVTLSVSKRDGDCRLLKPFFSRALLTAVLLLSCSSMDPDTVGMVNGYPVTTSEFEFHMAPERSRIRAYFLKRHGAKYEKDFWTNTYGGEVPAQVLKNKTWEKTVSIKVRQALALRMRVTDSISFTSFQNGFREENERRRQALAEGRVIYGPRQYSLEGYFQHTENLLGIALKKKLSDSMFVFSEAALKGFYESNRDKYYRYHDSIQTEIISWPSSGSSASRAGRIEALLITPGGFQTIIRHPERFPGIRVQSRLFCEATAIADGRSAPALMEAAYRLASGEVSPVLESGDGNRAAVRCLQRRAGGFRPFPEAKGNVLYRIKEQRYEAFLDSCVRSAALVVNLPVLRKRVP